ncbi:GNAT family N-acetyltransferase [Porphyrobacter sp. YT40]|uniref:GNAT family N-acetyltransferase n=1 Tax=Porphyrobacter sp. YT40 TaxID=2547601 RepID=UPI0015E8B50A|nr:GNAT family N-acetyltransferase [Porphyrobacter sp. YT40]
MTEQTPQLTITHHVAGQGGRYVAVVEGAAEEGYLEWEPGKAQDGKEVRIAAHTIVPRAIGGRGVAAALVEQLVADARRNDFLIRPDCSYVAKKFAENPDWAALKA